MSLITQNETEYYMRSKTHDGARQIMKAIHKGDARSNAMCSNKSTPVKNETMISAGVSHSKVILP
ncbi:MAG: hypothetical protein R6W78_12005 [Bacteroidales bacterium]